MQTPGLGWDQVRFKCGSPCWRICFLKRPWVRWIRGLKWCTGNGVPSTFFFPVLPVLIWSKVRDWFYSPYVTWFLSYGKESLDIWDFQLLTCFCKRCLLVKWYYNWDTLLEASSPHILPDTVARSGWKRSDIFLWSLWVKCISVFKNGAHGAVYTGWGWSISHL